MKFIDDIIVSMFPRYGVRRLQGKQAVKAYYESGQASNTLKQRVSNTSPDVDVNAASANLRANARHLEQNYDLAKGVLTTLVANVVGMGIHPIPMIKNGQGDLHTEANKEVLKLYKNWARNPEVTCDYDEASAQRIACRTWLRDGELFTQLISGNMKSLDHKTIVPFSYELIEADYVPLNLNDDKKGIVQGVQKNKWGCPNAYHIYKNLDINANAAGSFGLLSTQDTKRVPAKNILHLKLTDRIRQTRGVTMFSTIMQRFEDIKYIEESERVAARVAAAMAGFIRKGAPDMYVAPNNSDEYREMEFMPGMIFDDLKAGEEVQTTNSNRPNNEVIPFLDMNLRFAAAGAGTSFSSIAKNYNGTYSAQRQELVEQYMSYGILWSYFSKRQVLPIYEEFLKMAVTARLLKDFADIDESTLYDVSFTRPPLTWIDPKKEMDGIEKELTTGISSKTAIIRRRNGDPEEILQQRIEEAQQEKDAGLTPPEKTEESDKTEKTEEPPDEEKEE